MRNGREDFRRELRHRVQPLIRPLIVAPPSLAGKGERIFRVASVLSERSDRIRALPGINSLTHKDVWKMFGLTSQVHRPTGLSHLVSRVALHSRLHVTGESESLEEPELGLSTTSGQHSPSESESRSS